jgi:hypothetical protein
VVLACFDSGDCGVLDERVLEGRSIKRAVGRGAAVPALANCRPGAGGHRTDDGDVQPGVRGTRAR